MRLDYFKLLFVKPALFVEYAFWDFPFPYVMQGCCDTDVPRQGLGQAKLQREYPGKLRNSPVLDEIVNDVCPPFMV